MAISAIGSAVTWLGSGTIGASIVSGALIGAAIGGITSAVTGGSIAKGMLFGAVGGAVTGGITGYFTQAGSELATGTAMANTSQAAIDFELGVGTMGDVATKAATETAVSGGGFMSKIGTEVLKGGVEGAFKMGAGILEGMSQEEIAKMQANEAAKERAWKSSEAAKDRASAEARSSGGGGGGSDTPDHFAEELAFRKEELYANLGQRKAEMNRPYQDAARARTASKGTLAGMRAIRRGKAPEGLTPQEKQYNGPVALEGGDTNVVKVDENYQLPEGSGAMAQAATG